MSIRPCILNRDHISKKKPCRLSGSSTIQVGRAQLELGQPRQEQRNRRDWPGPLVSILVRVEQVTPVSSIFQSIGRSRFSGYEGSVREILVGYGWNPVKEVQQATIALLKEVYRVHTLIKYLRGAWNARSSLISLQFKSLTRV